jgi:hypothetical protein
MAYFIDTKKKAGLDCADSDDTVEFELLAQFLGHIVKI